MLGSFSVLGNKLFVGETKRARSKCHAPVPQGLIDPLTESFLVQLTLQRHFVATPVKAWFYSRDRRLDASRPGLHRRSYDASVAVVLSSSFHNGACRLRCLDFIA
jgi:hypothetical protein